MAPLLEAARAFDIATNPAPAALFEMGSAGFQIWCTPEDNPGGLWTQAKMIAGGFTKSCAFLASVGWIWDEDRPAIVGIALTTVGYALLDAGLADRKTMINRPDDVTWAKQKIEWLWQASRATGKMPPIRVKDE